MRHLAIAAAVLMWGCDDAPAPQPPPPTPLQRPAPKTAAVDEEKKADVAPVVAGPAGLERSKVGDQLVYSWSQLLLSKDAMAKAFGSVAGARAPNMGSLAPSAATGRLTITRIEPASPFTFLVELETGAESTQQVYTYIADVAPRQVLLTVDPAAAKKATPAAGQTFQAVQKEGKLIDPDASQLALSGGLISETRKVNGVGELMVALQKVGAGTRLADGGKVRMVDTFETPLDVGIRGIDPFLQEVKDARQAVVKEAVLAAASKCKPAGKSEVGRLDLQISSGNAQLILWNNNVAPAAFTKCLKASLNRMKLPAEMMAVSAELR